MNRGRRNLVAFYYPLHGVEFVPAKGDFVEYDGLGFEVVSRTVNYRLNCIEVRAFCNYEGTDIENY